jgi:hypothetical protein
VSLEPAIWWPLGAVLASGAAFAWLLFFAWAESFARPVLNWASHWALMALFASLTALVLGVWWTLR